MEKIKKGCLVKFNETTWQYETNGKRIGLVMKENASDCFVDDGVEVKWLGNKSKFLDFSGLTTIEEIDSLEKV
jgi:hypothetical protein